jgi:very-short-patch-repair endonuclease
MLRGLDGVNQCPLEVLVPRWARRQRRRDVKVHEARDIIALDRTEYRGIPCASVVRILVDVPAVLTAQRADQMWEDALRRRLCTVDQVADRFVQVARRGRPGTRVGRELLARRVGRYVPTMSEFERRVAELIERAGLPAPQRQHAVRLDETTVYLDLAWPDLMIGIECDGLFDHGSNVRLPWDDDRQNELQLRGWLILRFTWETLTTRPDHIVEQLRLAHGRR